jgi:hypothetical protein
MRPQPPAQLGLERQDVAGNPMQSRVVVHLCVALSL